MISKTHTRNLVDVVLPCYNEAAALPNVLAGLPVGYRAIVVDNNSIDDSAQIARRLGAHVIHERRQGFGAAVHAGVMAATAPYVAICDCDDSLALGELIPMLARLENTGVGMVLGRRRAVDRRAWPLSSRLANRGLALLLWVRLGIRIHDLSPIRILRRDTLLGLNLQDRRSGYPLEMLLNLALSGQQIIEVDVPYRARIGKSKVTGTPRGFATAVLDMGKAINQAGRQHGRETTFQLADTR